jgi:hypothetical protein
MVVEGSDPSTKMPGWSGKVAMHERFDVITIWIGYFMKLNI